MTPWEMSSRCAITLVFQLVGASLAGGCLFGSSGREQAAAREREGGESCETGGVLEGTVYEPVGLSTPVVPDARIGIADGPETVTDQGGRYRLEVPPGEHTLFLELRGSRLFYYFVSGCEGPKYNLVVLSGLVAEVVDGWGEPCPPRTGGGILSSKPRQLYGRVRIEGPDGPEDPTEVILAALVGEDGEETFLETRPDSDGCYVLALPETAWVDQWLWVRADGASTDILMEPDDGATEVSFDLQHILHVAPWWIRN